MIRIAFHLEGAPLHRADDESAARCAFAACCGVISAQTIVGVLWHLGVGLAFDITRSGPAAGQYGSGRCPYTGKFQKITPGDFFTHSSLFPFRFAPGLIMTSPAIRELCTLFRIIGCSGSVTVETPAHVHDLGILGDFHLAHIAMTSFAIQSSRDMRTMDKMHKIWDLRHRHP